MARLIRSGTPIPTALELLARDTPRGVARFLRELNDRIKAGEPLGEAMLKQRPHVTELEASIITAATRSGRLDHGCEQLSRYFDALVRARSEMLSRMGYPIVMLHLAAFLLNVQYVNLNAMGPYFAKVAETLVPLYALAFGIWFAWNAVVEAARTNVTADRILRLIPGIGPIREKFALARFFSTLDAQLEAGLNVWDSFANAAKTSDSARIISAARQGMPMLRAGGTLSEVLSAKDVLPVEYIRSFRVAEKAGELDSELTNLAKRSEELAVAALVRWSEWLPRVMYSMVVFYIGWLIVRWYTGYLGSITKIMDQ